MSEIIPKVIVELPYVTGRPDPTARPDQRTIQYIRNGECFEAGDYEGDDSGTLNRPSSEIQKNAATLLVNDKIINSSLAEVITRVNAHDITLGQIGDDNLANKVEELENQYSPIPEKIVALEQADFITTEDIKKINDCLGEKSESDLTPRKLYDDVTWIKTEMGNYAGFNINGQPDAESMVATGMKYRIIALGQKASQNSDRIKKLEDDWIHSDVGNLQNEINEIRTELGEKGEAPADGVYKWIELTNGKIETNKNAIEQINTDIGVKSPDGTINERIVKNKEDIAETLVKLNDTTTKADLAISSIGTDSTPTTLSYRLKGTEDSVATLTDVVGKDINFGLQSVVSNIANTVGNSETPGTIISRLDNTETVASSSAAGVSEINNRIGNNTPGSETGMERRIKILEIDSRKSFAGIIIGGNTSSASLTTAEIDIPMDISKSHAMEDTTDFEVTGLSMKYTGTESKVMDYKISLNINTITAPVKFILYRKPAKSGQLELINTIIQPGVTHVQVTFPVKLQWDDSLYVKVKSASEATVDNFIVHDGALYASELL